ncbi:YbaB/EbfC family nucleoid-associated protein [Actinophytocola algeriensis]|uniref:DNA-binding protein YbaB n=1 Tax=Actinophytocola algeriensis TaxID=1768010 RepID=A0A7W7VBB3_9PSEU|nr:YbaB/EbfC family nucleoid-associated protein [Actinophytocola algeriensis]MBB4903855.1 DNA-binding protein YbaB [Actinophytocola algeriensis]MBE1477288.1 DNA-binding protein YbaB [Actinophytocola algeriensis]
MIEREPVNRTTRQLIEDGRARQDALSKVDEILATVTGTAHDRNDTVEVTVDGRGKLKRLWLAQEAARYGADGLAQLIVKVAAVAMDDATQTGYNKVALLLGDNLTYALEQLSGRAAPARRPGDEGITAEEFQERRDRRVGANAPDSSDELDSFDPSSLRSDR